MGRASARPDAVVVPDRHDEERVHESVVADVAVALLPRRSFFLGCGRQNNLPKHSKQVSGSSVTSELCFVMSHDI